MTGQPSDSVLAAALARWVDVHHDRYGCSQFPCERHAEQRALYLDAFRMGAEWRAAAERMTGA